MRSIQNQKNVHPVDFKGLPGAPATDVDCMGVLDNGTPYIIEAKCWDKAKGYSKPAPISNCQWNILQSLARGLSREFGRACIFIYAYHAPLADYEAIKPSDLYVYRVYRAGAPVVQPANKDFNFVEAYEFETVVDYLNRAQNK